MDKPKSNPLVNPPENVLKAAVHLDMEASFNEIRKWLDSCLSHGLNRLPCGREDVEHRWIQGQVQTLLLIMNVISNPRAELLAREKQAEENALTRNL